MARDRKNREKEGLRALLRKKDKEISHLKKQMGRANKAAQREFETDLAAQDLEALSETIQFVPQFKVKDQQCPKCKHDKWVEVDMGVKMVLLCKGCGHRKILTKKP